MAQATDWLPAGRVGRPHGLDGSFHVTRPRGALLTLGGHVRIGDDETEVVRRSGTEERPILRVALAGDRQAIEALRGSDVWAPRAAAAPLGEDEWWARDLEGCAVADGDVAVGVVRRLLALPSCEALEVERTGGRPDLLVPLVRDAVRSVDIAAHRIDVDLAFLGEG